MGFIQAAREFNAIVGSGINFPSSHEARWLTDQVKYSPDLGYLEQKEFQLLFAVEDFKLRHPHHTLLEESAFVCTAYSTRNFMFWRMAEGIDEVPIPIETERTRDSQLIRYFPPPLKVKGELHVIRSHQFLGLDTYKRNTVQFRRKRVNVIVPYRVGEYKSNSDENIPIRELPKCLQGADKHFILGEERVHVIRAWMYVARPEYWDDLLDAGWRGFKPVDYHESQRPWLKEYYDYPNRCF